MLIRAQNDIEIAKSSNDLINAVNEYRMRKDRRPLDESECLTEQCTMHAVAMSKEGGLSHAGWLQRLRDCDYKSGAENVASGYWTASWCVWGWSRSFGHRMNMLGEWDMIGGAVHKRYYCCLFAVK